MVRESCYLKQGQSEGLSDMQWAEAWPCSPSPAGTAAKGTPARAASTGQWQKRARYLQSHPRRHFQKLSLLQASAPLRESAADSVKAYKCLEETTEQSQSWWPEGQRWQALVWKSSAESLLQKAPLLRSVPFSVRGGIWSSLWITEAINAPKPPKANWNTSQSDSLWC